jgi:Na+-transporting NADH:ubiquinone oxidoreductase subunit C
MNKEGNGYTLIYASVLVIVVAALLAFVATSLKPLQDRNEMVAKKIDILKSINIDSDAANAEEIYEKIIGDKSYIVNFKGEKVEGVAFNVSLADENRKPVEERLLPVFEASLEDDVVKYVIELRGNGLWGPIWGYIAINDDGNTLYGATFSHKGETPGLGAEIAGDNFQDQFPGKQIFENGKNRSIDVVKGGADPNNKHEVDGISGGTITSNGLSNMLDEYFIGYESFLKNIERSSHE